MAYPANNSSCVPPTSYPPMGSQYNDGNVFPTAPPLHKLQVVPGYEGNTFETTILPPPSYPQPQQPPPNRETVGVFSGITEEQARDAAIQFASENCCYGSDTVKEMIITNIVMSSAFHYTLETFSEKRETLWCSVPYNGEILDTPMNGPAPGPWDIPLVPKQHFHGSSQLMEVPHTASAITCHVCSGCGKERCSKCDGCGHVNCNWCQGRGRRFSDEMCDNCSGTGKDRCTNCHGNGLETCSTCAGKGSLKCYVKLTATWTNHMDDFLSEQTSVPIELIRCVTGHVVFEEQYPRVWPVNHFPEVLINQASSKLVSKHSQAFPTERILQQRHSVRIVPVATVNYSWKGNQGNFFVYGFEHKVHFPDYPQTCCCGCTIL